MKRKSTGEIVWTDERAAYILKGASDEDVAFIADLVERGMPTSIIDMISKEDKKRRPEIYVS